MNLEDNRLYTPDEVSAAGWLGSDTSPEALRKAARKGDIECTRFRGRIYFTSANIRAIQEAGFQEASARQSTKPAAPGRGRRFTVAAVTTLPGGVTPLQAKPQPARRRSRKAS